MSCFSKNPSRQQLTAENAQLREQLNTSATRLAELQAQVAQFGQQMSETKMHEYQITQQYQQQYQQLYERLQSEAKRTEQAQGAINRLLHEKDRYRKLSHRYRAAKKTAEKRLDAIYSREVRRRASVGDLREHRVRFGEAKLLSTKGTNGSDEESESSVSTESESDTPPPLPHIGAVVDAVKKNDNDGEEAEDEEAVTIVKPKKTRKVRKKSLESKSKQKSTSRSKSVSSTEVLQDDNIPELGPLDLRQITNINKSNPHQRTQNWVLDTTGTGVWTKNTLTNAVVAAESTVQ